MKSWEAAIRSISAALCLVLGIVFLMTGKPIAIVCGVAILAGGCIIVFSK